VSDTALHSHATGGNAQAFAFRVRKDLLGKAKAVAAKSGASVPHSGSSAQITEQTTAQTAARSVHAETVMQTSATVPAPAIAVSEVTAIKQAVKNPVAVSGAWRKYLMAALIVTTAVVSMVFVQNRRFNAEMYDDAGMMDAAKGFARGEGYANFDLNINIRKLRDLHIAEMTETPDMVLFGASHWQEAHNNLVTHLKWYNSHIHREFWQDLLGVTYMWESRGRLPKKLIIALRDNIFAPIESRPDFLWEPGIPYWRNMADQLGIEKEPVWKSLPYHRFRERFSLAMLYNNFARWAKATEVPHTTKETSFKALDVLMPDGSIMWSKDHLDIFTPERTLRESLSFAAVKIKSPPLIEERGVEAFDKLLAHLKSKGVTIYFARPPYNPQFWEAVKGTAYMDGLKPVIAVQDKLAAKYGIQTIGSFNPYEVGCTPDQYIDSEHAKPECLQKIFDQFTDLDKRASEK
jgi:hypothetical protein